MKIESSENCVTSVKEKNSARNRINRCFSTVQGAKADVGCLRVIEGFYPRDRIKALGQGPKHIDPRNANFSFFAVLISA